MKIVVFSQIDLQNQFNSNKKSSIGFFFFVFVFYEI